MSRGLTQFLRRNVTGEQSLKPVVRSYYSHMAETAYSPADHNNSDTVTDWLRPEPSITVSKRQQSHAEHVNKATRDNQAHMPGSQPDFNREVAFPKSSDTISETPKNHEKQDEQDSVEPERITSKARPESLQPDEGNSDFPERWHHTDFPRIETRVPSTTLANKQKKTLAELRDLEPESQGNEPSKQAKTQPDKRRDFTRQVAASILGNDATTSRESLLIAEPVTESVTDPVEVSVTINHVSIVSAAKAPEKKVLSWKPPVSLTDYLRERREGN